MSVNRLFHIVYTLLQKKQVTAKELAEQFEVSVRTIYRDVVALSEAGVPIYALPGKGGGIALMEAYILPKVMISDAEQEQLLIALQSLAPTEQLHTDALASKLGALFQKPQVRWIEVDLTDWGRSEADRMLFDLLRQAIVQHQWVAFEYMASNGRASARTVQPARLVFKAAAWYLQAWCRDRQDFRTFKVQRMRRVQALDAFFENDLNPPPLEMDGGTGPIADLLLRFAPQAAYRVMDMFGEHRATPQPDGGWLVRASFPEDGWLYGFLLSFGAGVEVIEPARVRHALAQEAEKILRICAEVDTQVSGKGC